MYYRGQPRAPRAAQAARALVDAALARHPLATLALEDRPYSYLALCYAQAGAPERARRLLAEYERAVPEGWRRGDAFRFAAAGALALADGRIPEAIRGYRAWYDESGCTACGLFQLGQAHDRAHQPDSALAVYERAASSPGCSGCTTSSCRSPPPIGVWEMLYVERGDAARAKAYYGRFVDLWKEADPELQPIVRDVRARLARLSAEPKR